MMALVPLRDTLCLYVRVGQCYIVILEGRFLKLWLDGIFLFLACFCRKAVRDFHALFTILGDTSISMVREEAHKNVKAVKLGFLK